MENILLASASPRRAQLLRQIGMVFDVVASGVEEENVTEEDPVRLAEYLAMSKAKTVAAELDRGIVIAADTVVCVEGELLGKPVDEEDAWRMLRLLSGRCHQVMTGVAVIRQPGLQTLCHVETTKVCMRPITEEEMRWYIHSGEAWDKAGGYGIQGKAAVFVERIEGCYFNVVGLPLAALWQMLKQCGFREGAGGIDSTAPDPQGTASG